MTAVVVPVLEMLVEIRSDSQGDAVRRERVPVVMDEVAAPLEDVLECHGEDLGWFLERTVRTSEGRWPWAWIFFPECYPLANHVRSVRGDAASMPFTLYGREPDPVPSGWTPCVGAVLPMTKDVLREAVERSRLFESAWLALADRAADTSWACLSDPLDDEWLGTVRDP